MILWWYVRRNLTVLVQIWVSNWQRKTCRRAFNQILNEKDIESWPDRIACIKSKQKGKFCTFLSKSWHRNLMSSIFSCKIETRCIAIMSINIVGIFVSSTELYRVFSFMAVCPFSIQYSVKTMHAYATTIFLKILRGLCIFGRDLFDI